MKLRNKHTREVEEFNEIYLTKTVKETNTATSEYVERSYYGIDELNADWEDAGDIYVTNIPLIKDEKIRKAVRAWAEADGADEKIYLTIDENGSRFANKYGGYIEFAFQIDMEERLYTITELCGEEEE